MYRINGVFSKYTNFTDAVAYTFGQGSTLPVVLDDVSCSGTESRLIDCTYDSNTADCSHSDDAGVRCQLGWLYILASITILSMHACLLEKGNQPTNNNAKLKYGYIFRP